MRVSSVQDVKRKRDQISDSDSSQEPPVSDQGSDFADRNSPLERTASSRPRNCLTKDKAIEIYKKRPEMMGFKKSRRGTMVGCEAVAVEFGVTPKTIRDIWRGRTWGEATGHPQSDRESRFDQYSS